MVSEIGDAQLPVTTGHRRVSDSRQKRDKSTRGQELTTLTPASWYNQLSRE